VIPAVFTAAAVRLTFFGPDLDTPAVGTHAIAAGHGDRLARK
jgi:hypothetical protein